MSNDKLNKHNKCITSDTWSTKINRKPAKNENIKDYIQSGLIVDKDKNAEKIDYLYIFGECHIYIFDLVNKQLIKNIEIKLGGCIGNIIHWNNKYIIFIDEKDDDVLKIVDLTINKIICVIKPIDIVILKSYIIQYMENHCYLLVKILAYG